MKNQTNKATIKSSVKSAINNIEFNWVDVDEHNITDSIYLICFVRTPFGYYEIKRCDYPSVCYRLYFNDYAISEYVDDIDSLKSAAIDGYRMKLSKAFNI